MTLLEQLAGLSLGAVRCALGIALAWAALGKTRGFAPWRRGLANYGLRGAPLEIVALGVIAVEALAAAFIFSPASDRSAGLVGSALGAAFVATQSYLLAAGERVPCLCFGDATEPVSIRSWTKAALVLVAGLLLLFAGRDAGWSHHALVRGS